MKYWGNAFSMWFIQPPTTRSLSCSWTTAIEDYIAFCDQPLSWTYYYQTIVLLVGLVGGGAPWSSGIIRQYFHFTAPRVGGSKPGRSLSFWLKSFYFLFFCSVSVGKCCFSIRKSISTSERHAEHPFTGGNTQHISDLNDVLLICN